MAVYLMPVLLGPCIAPVLAGVCTEYIPNDFGWRKLVRFEAHNPAC